MIVPGEDVGGDGAVLLGADDPVAGGVHERGDNPGIPIDQSVVKPGLFLDLVQLVLQGLADVGAALRKGRSVVSPVAVVLICELVVQMNGRDHELFLDHSVVGLPVAVNAHEIQDTADGGYGNQEDRDNLSDQMSGLLLLFLFHQSAS